MIDNIKENCCGCEACVAICPKKAITMKRDDKGFNYPHVNKKKCIECGLCVDVCGKQKFNTVKNIYAAKAKKGRKNSQSGGAFFVMAKKVILDGGVVYGVVNDNLQAVYQRAESLEEIKKMRGSKYVQATITNIYTRVIEDLKKNRLVCFFGTPCYINGLLSLVKKRKLKEDNLITCDLICHGVPSPSLLEDYLELLNNRYSKVYNFNHRDKCNGWHGHITSFNTKKGKYISNNYVELFYSNLELRDSCYCCEFSCPDRISDITIGDYWGIEKIRAKFDDNKGVSLITINTDKGMSLWDKVQNKFEYFKSNIHECSQPNLISPTRKPELYNKFWDTYFEEGFESAATKYCNFSWSNDKKYILFLLRKKVGKLLRRLHFLK